MTSAAKTPRRKMISPRGSLTLTSFSIVSLMRKTKLHATIAAMPIKFSRRGVAGAGRRMAAESDQWSRRHCPPGEGKAIDWTLLLGAEPAPGVGLGEQALEQALEADEAILAENGPVPVFDREPRLDCREQDASACRRVAGDDGAPVVWIGYPLDIAAGFDCHEE